MLAKINLCNIYIYIYQNTAFSNLFQAIPLSLLSLADFILIILKVGCHIKILASVLL